MRRSLLACSFVAALFGCLVGCERTYDGKKLVLDWTDPSTKIAFWITEDPGLIKTNNTLHVERDGRNEARLIDDDASFSTVTLVRYEHWLLVVCRGVDEVWAGYDYDTGKLYGEYDWPSLPFTHWSGQGSVVAERKLGDQSASPVGFPGSPATQKKSEQDR